MDEPQRVERKLAAILVADVVGYSRLMGLDEADTLARLKALRRDLIGPKIAGYRGRIVKLMGDGALVEFASVVDATACAVEIQRGMAERNATIPADRQIAFRIGINLGDVIVEGDDIYGDGVNIAARLEGLCEPGGIAVSGTAYDQAKNKLDVGFKSLGLQSLKNIAEPVRVYRVLLDTVAPSARRPRQRRWIVPAAAAVLLLAVVAGAVTLWPWAAALLTDRAIDTGAGAPSDTPSIAVLPFTNLSGNAEEDYFADGLTADLITDLSKISGLMVISRNSTFGYRGQSADAREVAEQLGVGYVLEGTVRRSEVSIRINAQLIDGTTGNNIWAERYDRDYGEIFALQDEVIARIVEALAVHLTDAEQSRIARLPTRNLEAYDLYLRAEQRLDAADFDSLGQAIAHYQRAIALDPEFADAYAGYARALADILSFDYQALIMSAVARQRAYEAAGRALELNPQLPRPYAVLGILQMLDGEFDEAIGSVQQAVALDPSGAESQLNLAIVLTYAGQHPEALAAMEQVLRLDPKPKSQVYDYYGLVLYMNHRYEEAIEALRRVADEVHSDFGWETLAMAYARLNRMADARAAIDSLLERWPARSLSVIRVIYAHHRRQEDLDDRLDALRDAGLPEWPFDFRGSPEDRLDQAAIRDLTLGNAWVGRQQEGREFIMQVSASGEWVLGTQGGLVLGRITFEDDLLCKQSPALLLGRTFCSPVYRNPGGTPEAQNEYVVPDTQSVWYFSVAPP